MLKLNPEIKDYIWGGKKLEGLFGCNNGDKRISESWEVSVHPDGEAEKWYALSTDEGGYIKELTACKYFTCRRLELDGTYEELPENSFLAVNILDGEGEINGEAYTAGDSFFIPCGEKMALSGKAVAILTTRSNLKYYAGIDLGGTFVKCGIVDSCGRLLKKGSVATGGGFAKISSDMAALALSLADEVGVKLSGIGIGAPGTVDGKNGVILYSNNLGWRNVPLTGEIEKITGVKAYATNDANAAALGEYAFGAGKQYDNIVFVTLGTGVGGGIIIDGKIYEGLCGAGAELGHMVIVKDGEQCTCGRRGCLEAYASASALVRQGKSYMGCHDNTILCELCGGDAEALDGRIFFDAVRKGDKGALDVYNKYLDYLSEGLVNFANIFRPDAIILGGGISAVGELLTLPLSERMAKNIYGENRYAPVKILTSDLANDAGLFGAARLAMVGGNQEE